MSTCISPAGEYSDHVLDDAYTCTRCLVLDEDAMVTDLRGLRARLSEVETERDAAREDANRSWNKVLDARTAARGLTSSLIANAALLETPFTDEPSLSPWTRFVGPRINNLRAALGMRGVAANCCDMHGRTCEPGELCCGECTEGAHPHHVDGSFCSSPDLSGVVWPAPPVEDALRDEVERLRARWEAAQPVLEAAVEWRRHVGDYPLPANHLVGALIAAVDALPSTTQPTQDHPTATGGGDG